MRRRHRIAAGVGTLVLAAGVAAVITATPALTLAETDAFHRDLRALPLIVHDSPTDLAHWRRRCSAALHAPSQDQRAAVARIVVLVASRPEHRLVVDAGQPRPTVRSVVLGHADDLIECRRRVTAIPIAWVGIERELRAAAARR